MTDFGFGLSRSSTIDLDRYDTGLYRQVREKYQAVGTCINCGSCVASCAAGSFGPSGVRRAILAIQRGQDPKPFLSHCFLCGKCTMVCPRGINTRNLILEIERRLYD